MVLDPFPPLLSVTSLIGSRLCGGGSYAKGGGDRQDPWTIKTEVNSQQLEQYLDIHLYWLNISTDALVILITVAKCGINYKNSVKWI